MENRRFSYGCWPRAEGKQGAEVVECFLSFGFLVVVIVALVAVAWEARARTSRWNRAYRALAQRYGGAFQPAGWFRRPSVRFRHGPAQVLLNTHPAPRSSGFTQLQILWPDLRLRLEVFPRRSRVRFKPLRSMHEVAVGAAEFDRCYVVRGSNAHDVCRFLSDAVRWQLERLRHLLGDGEVYLLVLRGRMLIKKPTLIRRFEQLDQFTRLALQLYDQAALTRASGIQFVEENRVQVIDGAICQICGEAITSDMVFCRRCKTPHHRDCWHYYGSCAVFGCQEHSYVTPRVAGPPADG